MPVRIDDLPAYPHILDIGSIAINYLANGALTIGTVAESINFIRLAPFLCRRTGVIGTISFNQTAAGGAGSKTRIGIYPCDQTTLSPLNLAPLFDSGDIATDGANGNKPVSPNLSVTVGQWIWLAHTCGVSAPTIESIATTGLSDLVMGWSLSGGVGTAQKLLFAAATYAAFPNPLPALSVANATMPAIYVHYSA